MDKIAWLKAFHDAIAAVHREYNGSITVKTEMTPLGILVTVVSRFKRWRKDSTLTDIVEWEHIADATVDPLQPTLECLVAAVGGKAKRS